MLLNISYTGNVNDVMIILIFVFLDWTQSMKKILILMFSCALILASCAGPKSATDKKSMLKDIDKKDKLVYQEMKAKLKINFPDLKNTADAVIKLQNSDTLAIDIFGPFGVKFGKLWADKDNFIFLNYFQSVVFTGTPSAENFKTAAMIDLSFDDLTAMMRAEPIADFSEYSIIEENETTTLFGRKVGNIAEFIIYVNMLTWPMASIGWVTSIIQRAAASHSVVFM